MVKPVGYRPQKSAAMIELLVMNRFVKLLQQYLLLKEETKRLLAEGNIKLYAPKLLELQKVRAQLDETAKLG
jgi:hypothetical protein